jgi:hypothetical protein
MAEDENKEINVFQHDGSITGGADLSKLSRQYLCHKILVIGEGYDTQTKCEQIVFIPGNKNLSVLRSSGVFIHSKNVRVNQSK